jgi:hypothetical protein
LRRPFDRLRANGSKYRATQGDVDFVFDVGLRRKNR